MFTLTDDEVHVWRLWLDQPEATYHRLEGVLSADERRRAAGFYTDVLRRRFVVGRGLLRTILGRYTASAPDRLHFEYGVNGKPALAAACGGDALHFNLSHSHRLALLAVTRYRAIGVDLEYTGRPVDVTRLARRCFSPRENQVLQNLPDDRKREAFFRCWTRKEAYIKAIGDGLAYPLHRFDVTLAPHEPARLLRVLDAPTEALRWSLQTVAPAPDYIGALAVEGDDWHLERWCWQWK